MYLMWGTQSAVIHAPLSTPRRTSLHQPSTRAERSFGRFSQASASHWPRDLHSVRSRGRPALFAGCAAVTPEGVAGGSAGTPPPAHAGMLANADASSSAERLAFMRFS